MQQQVKSCSGVLRQLKKTLTQRRCLQTCSVVSSSDEGPVSDKKVRYHDAHNFHVLQNNCIQANCRPFSFRDVRGFSLFGAVRVGELGPQPGSMGCATLLGVDLGLPVHKKSTATRMAVVLYVFLIIFFNHGLHYLNP